jgi:hypothetical protein
MSAAPPRARSTANAPARAFAVFVSLACAASAGCVNGAARGPEYAAETGSAAGSGTSATPDRGSRSASNPSPLAAPASLVQRMRRLGFLPIAVLLPDAEGWLSARDEARLYEAAHPASASRLVAELVDGTFGTSVQCARMQPRSVADARARFDEGSVRAPLALDVAFEAFADERPDGAVTGTIVGYTAYGGRCTRLLFETRARGAEAAAEVGARLAFFRDVSLPSLLIVRDGHGPAPVRTNLERR